jgi:SAM-dependent methyltransferase
MERERKEQFYGAREETLRRMEKLYVSQYFGNPEMAQLRKKQMDQEFERLKNYFGFIDEGNGKVLDIGCGTGEFLSHFNEKWTKYGIEISDFARKLAEEKGVITDFELKDNFFDLIIFRGTIQHIPDPIHRIEQCFYWLKEGGGLVFLATPNTNSWVYRLFNDLPMIDKRYNFLLPSDKMLDQILINFGFHVLCFEYPYKGTPYAHPSRDLCRFILRALRIRKKVDFAFYRNMIECYAKK